MAAAGWLDLNNRRGQLTVNGLDIALAGVHDPHAERDRYDLVAGPADPAAALRLGVLHSPEPAVMDLFAADGYDLLLAGHTHGGQLRVPGYGALVTNCGIDRAAGQRPVHAPPGVPGGRQHRLAATFPPASAPHRGPRPGSPAARRRPCSLSPRPPVRREVREHGPVIR